MTNNKGREDTHTHLPLNRDCYNPWLHGESMFKQPFSGPLGTRLWHLSYQWIIYIYIVKLNFETTFLWFHGLWSLLCLHTAIIRHITRLIRPLTWPPNYTFHTTKEKMPLDNSKKQTQRRLCVKWAASAAIWAPIKIPYRWVVAIDLLSLLGGPIAFQGFVEISIFTMQHEAKIHSYYESDNEVLNHARLGYAI